MGFLGRFVDVTPLLHSDEFEHRSAAILRAVGFVSSRLLRGVSWKDALQEVLRCLGEGAGVSRVYLFENRLLDDGALACSQAAEWAAPGIAPQIDNPELQNIPLVEAGYGRWVDLLGRQQVVHGPVAAFPEAERGLLEAQSIRSLAVLPIHAAGVFWGFLGFDDCLSDREWSEAELAALQVAATDIAVAIEREAGVEELRASERRYRSLFETAPAEIWEEDFSPVKQFLASEGFFDQPDPVAYLDARPQIVDEALGRLRVVAVNQEAVNRLGAGSKEELLGRMRSVFTAEALAAFRRQLVAIHRGERELTIESRARTLDGRLLEIILCWVVQPGHEEDYGRVLVTGIDLTELRALEAEVEAARRLEIVGKLAGGVAHDFNNLLTIVGSSAEFLETALAGDRGAQADLERIRGAARRATELTAQLLAVGRRQILRPTRVDLNQVVTDLRVLLERVIPENIVIETRLCDGPALADIDRAKLEQVLMNLVLNARDAMLDGGEVEVAIERQRETGDGTGHRITVRDTGTGMDGATLARCFEPFFTTKSEGAGAGLGLATAQGVVKQSGGEIRVESELGRGTTATVLLPGASGVGTTPAPLAPAQPVGGDERILLVEDDEMVRWMVAQMLERLGYRVNHAATPAEALERFARGEEFDLLLTDLVMPGLSGRALAERAREAKPGIAVLLMSGYSSELVENGLDARTGFLAKPFHSADLDAAVRAALLLA